MNAFQRKEVQNHFKESDKLPGLSKAWLKALQRKNVSIRTGAGQGIKERERSVHPGTQVWAEVLPVLHSLCTGATIMEMDASGQLSLLSFNVLNAELSALALIPRSPSKLPVTICSPL